MTIKPNIHGGNNRGLAAGAIPGVAYGRFGPMFNAPPAPKLPPEGLRALAMAMIKKDDGKFITEDEPVDENPTIPAGYTYFGQFIDHDITFDPTPLSQTDVDPGAMVDFRSPALDLDNLYGRGPDDQPYMYNGLQLRTGDSPGHADAFTGSKADLFRLSDGTPILGDKRNDENKIVSQFHGAMIQFHNKVVADETLLSAFGGDISSDTAKFRTAANIVRWHYQWVVIHDYLNRVCEPGMVTEVLNPGGTPRLQHYLKEEARFAYMPIEFSGAAFRFGHSMVRPSYSLNSQIVAAAGDTTRKTRVPTFSRKKDITQNLNGFPGPLASDWGLDFGFFLDVPPGTATASFKLPQASYRIDAILAGPLEDLPEFFGLVGNLAFRNLERGQMLGLPSGQAVSRLLGIEPLSDDILWTAGSRMLATVPPPGDTAKDLKATNDARARIKEDWVDGNGGILKCNAPLWYYILREAEWYGVTNDITDPAVGFGGQHLGPVGSRIVAETLIGLLWMDPASYLHDLRGFKPMAEITRGAELTLASLLEYALA
jgi:hypothetical protein